MLLLRTNCAVLDSALHTLSNWVLSSDDTLTGVMLLDTLDTLRH